MNKDMPQNPRQNRLLAALRGEEFNRLLSELEAVDLPSGKLIYESGKAIDYVYFPTSAIVSLVSVTRDGATAELGMTGNDGMVGITLVLGGETASHQVIVQNAGGAYRLRAELMRWEFDHGGELQKLALRYALALMTQVSQTALCNRHHSVDQQLCRWLLLTLDLLPDNEIRLTQALIASMLGVRREAVTEAAGRLQAAGLITYRRGRITVVDRLKLESRVCECYSVVKAQYDLMFHPVPDAINRRQPRLYPGSLRKRAEACLQHRRTNLAHGDMLALLHELQVHQIELEMQYEELERVYNEAETLRCRYADLYDFAPLAYVSIDALGVIRQINIAGAILLGIKRSEMVRHRFTAFLNPGFLSVFHDFFSAVMDSATKKTCEVELLPTLQRGPAFVHIEAVSDENSQECRMVMNDITERKRLADVLHQRELYQRALLDNFPFLVWLKDEDSRFLAVNRAFAEACDQSSPDALVGKTDLDFWPQDLAEAYRADDRAVLENGTPKHVEEEVELGGQRILHETYKSPVKIDNQTIGTVGFARNITLNHKGNDGHAFTTCDFLEMLVSLRNIIEGISESGYSDFVGEKVQKLDLLKANCQRLQEKIMLAQKKDKSIVSKGERSRRRRKPSNVD